MLRPAVGLQEKQRRIGGALAYREVHPHLHSLTGQQNNFPLLRSGQNRHLYGNLITLRRLSYTRR